MARKKQNHIGIEVPERVNYVHSKKSKFHRLMNNHLQTPRNSRIPNSSQAMGLRNRQ